MPTRLNRRTVGVPRFTAAKRRSAEGSGIAHTPTNRPHTDRSRGMDASSPCATPRVDGELALGQFSGEVRQACERSCFGGDRSMTSLTGCRRPGYPSLGCVPAEPEPNTVSPGSNRPRSRRPHCQCTLGMEGCLSSHTEAPPQEGAETPGDGADRLSLRTLGSPRKSLIGVNRRHALIAPIGRRRAGVAPWIA